MLKKKKVLLISYDYRPRLGGVATCSYELAKAISKFEHIRLKVLAPKMIGDDKVDKGQNFETIRVDLPDSAVKSIGILRKEIDEVLEDFRPDAIICMLWMPEAISVYLSKNTSVPYYIVTHGVEVLEVYTTAKKILRAMFSPLKRRVYRYAEHVFCVSNFTSNLVSKYCKIKNDRRSVVYNGVDFDAFRPMTPKQEIIKKFKKDDTTIFLTITRMDPFKGVDKAIESFHELKKTGAKFTYLVGGIGPDLMRLKKLVIKLGMEDEIIFLDKVPAADLIDYYNLCDCFVLLSRADMKTPNIEGFGLVFLEAGACEKAVIAGNSGGISDAVVDGLTGILVNPVDSQKIKNAFEFMIQNPDKRIEMGQRSRERILKEMNWTEMGSKIVLKMDEYVRN